MWEPTGSVSSHLCFSKEIARSLMWREHWHHRNWHILSGRTFLSRGQVIKHFPACHCTGLLTHEPKWNDVVERLLGFPLKKTQNDIKVWTNDCDLFFILDYIFLFAHEEKDLNKFSFTHSWDTFKLFSVAWTSCFQATYSEQVWWVCVLWGKCSDLIFEVTSWLICLILYQGKTFPHQMLIFGQNI